MRHTPRRRVRPRWAAAALLAAISLAVSACQVGGSASADPGVVASLQSAAATPSTRAASTSAPGTSLTPGTIEDHSTGNEPSGTPSGDATAPRDGSTVVFADDGYAVSVMVTIVWARALAAGGTKVGIRTIDEPADQLSALETGEVDLVQQYNSSLLDFFDRDAEATSQSDVDAALATKLPPRLTALKSTPARDGTQLVVSASTAATYRLHSISDLGAHLPQLTLLVPESDTSDDFAGSLSDYYGLTFPNTRTTDLGGVKTIAAVACTASVGLMNDSQYQIDDQKFVTLTDPEHLFFLENFIPVTTTKISPAMRSTINAVSAKLTVSAVRGMRKQVAAGGTASQIADAWLASVGLR